eukprot:9780790-Alexandrium_andersonii.AAC.1
MGGVSGLRRFPAAERVVWPVGHAGTVPPSGWILGPELTLNVRCMASVALECTLRHEHVGCPVQLGFIRCA